VLRVTEIREIANLAYVTVIISYYRVFNDFLLYMCFMVYNKIMYMKHNRESLIIFKSLIHLFYLQCDLYATNSAFLLRLRNTYQCSAEIIIVQLQYEIMFLSVCGFLLFIQSKESQTELW